MNDQIERVVESAHGYDNPDRFVPSDGNFPFRGQVQIHRDFGAGLGAQNLNAVPNTVNRARDLHAGIAQRLAPFPSCVDCELFGALGHNLRDFL